MAVNMTAACEVAITQLRSNESRAWRLAVLTLRLTVARA